MRRSNPQGPAVIVDPYSSGAFYAPAFAEAGIPVVGVVSAPIPPAVYAASYREADFPKILIAQEDLKPTVQSLLSLKPRCVLAGCESGVELADALAARVVPDVANDPDRASGRRHKGEMARLVAQAELPIIRQICSADIEEVADFIERAGLVGRDLVIKPPKSASTDGVTRVPRGEGWRQVFSALLGRSNRLGILNDQLVVQEYAHGIEYVVDSFSYAGTHTICDVCRYHKLQNGPHMAVYDSMEWLPPDAPEIESLCRYARGVLDAVGVRFGAAHIEIMLTDKGPRLIELGARPHGGGHPRFCRLATGDSQIDRAVRYFAGTGPIPMSFELRSNVLVVFFINRTAGTVRNADLMHRVQDLRSHYFSTVKFKNGDRLERTKDLFGSLDLGLIVLTHQDQAQVQADYQTIRWLESELRFDDKLPGQPASVARVLGP